MSSTEIVNQYSHGRARKPSFIQPGAGRWRYARILQSSRRSGSFQIDTGIDLQDPDLLDSIVNEYAVSAKRERRHHEPRYREAALSPLFQTAGFRSDATSDRADRLYILNGCEVMYKAGPARQCSGAGAQRRCLPSSVWNPWPTSPASQALELSSLHSLQLRAHSAAMSARLPTS